MLASPIEPLASLHQLACFGKTQSPKSQFRRRLVVPGKTIVAVFANEVRRELCALAARSTAAQADAGIVVTILLEDHGRHGEVGDEFGLSILSSDHFFGSDRSRLLLAGFVLHTVAGKHFGHFSGCKP